MIVLIDYGVGNLYSVEKAVAYVGGDVKISSSAEDIRRAEKIILPGVGAFGDCMKNLEATGLIPTIKAPATPKIKYLPSTGINPIQRAAIISLR